MLAKKITSFLLCAALLGSVPVAMAEEDNATRGDVAAMWRIKPAQRQVGNSPLISRSLRP